MLQKLSFWCLFAAKLLYYQYLTDPVLDCNLKYTPNFNPEQWFFIWIKMSIWVKDSKMKPLTLTEEVDLALLIRILCPFSLQFHLSHCKKWRQEVLFIYLETFHNQIRSTLKVRRSPVIPKCWGFERTQFSRLWSTDGLLPLQYSPTWWRWFFHRMPFMRATILAMYKQ